MMRFAEVENFGVLATVVLSAFVSCAGTSKRDLTVAPGDIREKDARPREWTQRVNPLFSLSAEGVDDIHLAYDGEQTPVLVLSNKTASVLELDGRISVDTFGGESFAIGVSSRLGAEACCRFEIGRGLKKGPWHAVALLETPDAKALAETRFAVVRRREIASPCPLGVFRAGMHYHMMRYTDTDNEKCIKALTQAGAKIVRGSIGASMADVERVEGTFDWSRPDRYLRRLEQAGLALDTNIYWAPSWAIDERHGKGHHGYSPMRPGLFRDYCKKLSARYGTRIAWYEIGNEWDLLKPERMTTDEAIAMQREAYEGIKASCPDAKVIPNGWAVAHSDVIPHRTQRNMQERLMTEARGFCDAHAVHQHGPYNEYRRRLGEFFAWRRLRGIDDLPWYSNESALTVAGAGEDRAAECIWHKILFAWMHGSVDYIWYNLRSSGFSPYDGEQGYGVMTADFYPRSTFASFAGLTSCFEGLRPRKIVHEGKSREVYLFSGVREGRDVQVFVGWDLKLETNIAVRIYTDAKRAFSVDLFDNRRELRATDGTVALSLGRTPSAVLLEDASIAVVSDSDVCRDERDEILDIAMDKDGHVFKLQDFDCVFEMYKADPMNFDRVWKGRNDLTASVKIDFDGPDLRIVANVRDEQLADGDCLFVIVDGVGKRFAPDCLIEMGARYVGKIACPKPESVMEIRVEDDDGCGKEGWVTTGQFRVTRN